MTTIRYSISVFLVTVSIHVHLNKKDRTFPILMKLIFFISSYIKCYSIVLFISSLVVLNSSAFHDIHSRMDNGNILDYVHDRDIDQRISSDDGF